MHITSKVTAKGQTTIPAEVRQHLKAEAGEHLRYVLADNGTVIVKKVPGLASLSGIFKSKVTLTDAELKQAVADARMAMARGDDWP